MRVAASELGVSGFEVELSFVSDRAMRTMNRAHRGKDKPTDVLTFPLFPAQDGVLEVPRWARGGLLGAVVIARETALRQAKAYAHPFSAEVARLLVHGLCHLVGYDHERGRRGEQRMFAMEDRILARLRKKA